MNQIISNNAFQSLQIVLVKLTGV